MVENSGKVCLYCGKPLIGRKIKYCDDLCSYRYSSIHKKESFRPYSNRLARLDRRTGRKRLGVSYGW